MILLLLLALQDRSLDDAVVAYAKGDDAMRAEILKGGACSIRPLLKVRAASPEKIDALLYDLKKAAAAFDPARLVDALDGKRSIDLAKTGFAVAHDELSHGLPLLFDPALFRTHYDAPVTLKFDQRPRREILEEMCRQLKLDYGFFYGVVVIAAPERLWPSGPLPRVTPLTENEVTRAAAWIERLAGDKVDDREEASAALRKMGEGVIPILEKHVKGGDREATARVRDLIAQIRKPPPTGVFHPPAAERQTLADADQALKTSLIEGQVGFKVADINLDGAMRLLLSPREIPFQLGPSLKQKRTTIDLQGVSTWTLLGLVLHSSGFDFLIRNGTLVVDTSEEIERQLASGR